MMKDLIKSGKCKITLKNKGFLHKYFFFEILKVPEIA